jgi:hypothetical protein
MLKKKSKEKIAMVAMFNCNGKFASKALIQFTFPSIIKLPTRTAEFQR